MMPRICLLLAPLALCLGACNPFEHPAQGAVQGFLDGIKYGDVTAIYLHHSESLPSHSTYCRSTQFKRFLPKVKASANEASCAQAKRVTSPDSNEPLDDELELLMQVTRFVCEVPQGDCLSYGKMVFYSQVEQQPLFIERPQSVKIHKIINKKDQAVAYVDLVYAADGPLKIQPRTMSLKLVKGKWLVLNPVTELLALPKPKVKS